MWQSLGMWIRVTKCPKWPSLRYYQTSELLLAAFSVEDFYMTYSSSEEEELYFGFWESSPIGEDVHRYLDSRIEECTAVYLFHGAEPVQSDIKYILTYFANKESKSSDWICDSLFTSCENCEYPIELDCQERDRELGHIKKNGTCCNMSGCTGEEWWEKAVFPLFPEQTDYTAAQFY